MLFLKSNIDPMFVFTSNDPCLMNREAVPLFLQIKMLCHAVLLDVGFIVGFDKIKENLLHQCETWKLPLNVAVVLGHVSGHDMLAKVQKSTNMGVPESLRGPNKLSLLVLK